MHGFTDYIRCKRQMKSCNYSHNLCVYTESRKADNNRCKYQFIHNRNSQSRYFYCPRNKFQKPRNKCGRNSADRQNVKKKSAYYTEKKYRSANGQYISDAVLKCDIEYFTHTSFRCCHSCRRGGVLVSAVKSKQNTDR